MLWRVREDGAAALEIHVSRRTRVKQRAYRGSQGEVVLAAWVNLEAGL